MPTPDLDLGEWNTHQISKSLREQVGILFIDIILEPRHHFYNHIQNQSQPNVGKVMKKGHTTYKPGTQGSAYFMYHCDQYAVLCTVELFTSLEVWYKTRKQSAVWLIGGPMAESDSTLPKQA